MTVSISLVKFEPGFHEVEGQDLNSVIATLNAAIAVVNSSLETLVTTVVAGTALAAHRLVKANVDGSAVYADNTDVPLSGDKYLGMTVAAAASGDPVQVVISGVVRDLTWNWDLTKPIFVGLTGLITQTAPTGGNLIIRVGFPILPTSVVLTHNLPIISV